MFGIRTVSMCFSWVSAKLIPYFAPVPFGFRYGSLPTPPLSIRLVSVLLDLLQVSVKFPQYSLSQVSVWFPFSWFVKGFSYVSVMGVSCRFPFGFSVSYSGRFPPGFSLFFYGRFFMFHFFLVYFIVIITFFRQGFSLISLFLFCCVSLNVLFLYIHTIYICIYFV